MFDEQISEIAVSFYRNLFTSSHLLLLGVRWKLLGSKTLGTNVLELQFVLCWQTMIKTKSLGLGLLKVCLFVKLESSDCRTYWTKSARFDRSKIRLDRSNHVQIYFSTEF